MSICSSELTADRIYKAGRMEASDHLPFFHLAFLTEPHAAISELFFNRLMSHNV